MDNQEPGALDSLDRKIEQLIAHNPAWSWALIAWRMACVGCDLAGYHTARQALEIYGIDEEEFQVSLIPGSGHPGASTGQNRNAHPKGEE